MSIVMPAHDREIILDTETTGFSHAKGDRVVEIGCIEVRGFIPTGRSFHCYLNPERHVPEAAVRVHGLDNARLANEPRFVSIVDEFLDFVGNAPLVAHNAPFDIGFLNAELRRAGRVTLSNLVIDTVSMAKKVLATSHVSLDELCRRFGVSLKGRAHHGALKDCALLAEVYVALHGGRDLAFAFDATASTTTSSEAPVGVPLAIRALLGLATDEEVEHHTTFIAGIKNNLWGLSRGP